MISNEKKGKREIQSGGKPIEIKHIPHKRKQKKKGEKISFIGNKVGFR